MQGEIDSLRAVAGAEQRLELPAPAMGVDQARPDLRRAADLSVALDEMHDSVGAPRQRLDRGAGIPDLGPAVRIELAHQVGGAVRERGDRGHRVHDLVGEHADEVALRGDLDRVQFALDRLHRDDPDEAAEPVDDRGADQHRLRHAVADQRHQPRPADGAALERVGEGVAIFAEVLDPDAAVAHQQAPRRLVGELDLAVAVDGEQGGRSVVEHGFVEAVGVDQLVLLVAHPPDRIVEHRAQLAEAAAVEAVREALAEIGEADRVDESGELAVGALDVAPEQGRGADDEQAGDDPRRAQPLDVERLDEGEGRDQQQPEPPDQADQEAAAKAHQRRRP